jgi:hypothetical protein
MKSSTAADRATAPEKKGSRHNPQHTGWPIHGSIPSFSPKTVNEAMGVKPPSVDNRLLGLPGPYLQQTIGTFNACSQGPTHWSLTNTGRGYNYLRAPPNLRLSNINISLKKNMIWSTYRRSVVFQPLSFYRSLYICLALTNVVQIPARSSRVTQKVFKMHLRFQSTPTNLMHNHY